jgi:hypothetical protein
VDIERHGFFEILRQPRSGWPFPDGDARKRGKGWHGVWRKSLALQSRSRFVEGLEYHLRMLRAYLLMVILTAACGSNAPSVPDAATHHDATAADAAGSGSDAFAALEAHPHDSKLELLVLGASVVVVVGPVRRSRRRRDAA